MSSADNVFPLSVIYGSHSPWTVPEFPLIHPSKEHTVLYQVSTNGFGKSPPPLAYGQDKWDKYHVKMPTSNKSVYDVDGFMKMSTNTENRWKIVENALSKKTIKNSYDLAKVILKYNTKFAHTWNFAAMHRFFNQYWSPAESQDFFKNTLPNMIRLTIDLPKLIQAPIPMLRKEENKSLSMSQLQIASLLANAFFCTFPRRNTTGPGTEYSDYPRINFTSLYESNADGIMEKLKCICHYFRRVCSSMPTGVVTFSRRHVPTHSCPNWERSQAPIASVPLHVDDRISIEEAKGLIQVDFANKYLGGGVLGGGLVQEEIRFVICPELMVAMLFTEKLGPNDALMIIGSERYSSYTGYGRVNFRWAGDFRDDTPIDSSGRRRTALLAIDAINYHDPRRQYHKDMILRELNKAWVGFSFYIDPSSQGLQYPGVATGNWGCGAFGGSPQVKSLIQIMACAQARRPIAYFTFKDAQVKDEVINAYNMLKRHNVTVGGLFNLLTKYSQTNSQMDLHTFLTHELKYKNKPPPHVPSGPPSQPQAPTYPSPQYSYNTGYPSPYGATSAHTTSYTQKARRSAPTHTKRRSDSPPSLSSSPSRSDICDNPNSKLPSSIDERYYKTGPSVDHDEDNVGYRNIDTNSAEQGSPAPAGFKPTVGNNPAIPNEQCLLTPQHSGPNQHESTNDCGPTIHRSISNSQAGLAYYNQYTHGSASNSASSFNKIPDAGQGPSAAQFQSHQRGSDPNPSQQPYRSRTSSLGPANPPANSTFLPPPSNNVLSKSSMTSTYRQDFSASTDRPVQMDTGTSSLSSDADPPLQDVDQKTVVPKVYVYNFWEDEYWEQRRN